MEHQPSPSAGRADTPDRDAIRAELEATRAAFHVLLASVSDGDWQRKSRNPAWTNREVLAHITGYLTLLPRFVGGARQGKGFPKPPLVLSRHLGTLFTRWAARKQTPRSLAQRYDAAHATALALLDGIRDEEWHRGASFPSGYQTVASFFRIHARHFAEHAAQVRPTRQRRASFQ